MTMMFTTTTASIRLLTILSLLAGGNNVTAFSTRPLVTPRAAAASRKISAAAQSLLFRQSTGKPQHLAAGTNDDSHVDKDLVDELLDIVKPGVITRASDRSVEDRERMEIIMKQLEQIGADCQYLDDDMYVGGDDNNNSTRTLLWDSYELAYFDRSIDAYNRSATPRKKASMRSKVVRSLFGLRYSFQHAVQPNLFVNDVGLKFLGLPASIVAKGNFTRITREDVDKIQTETGTTLRLDTGVRIDFETPVLWFGSTKFPVILDMGSKAQSPPVTLCTTYMDDRIRLALAAKGGRLIFTRRGKTLEPYAKDWETIADKKPIPGPIVGLSFLAGVGGMLKFVPATRVPVGIVAALTSLPILKLKFAPKKKKQTAVVEES